MKRSTNSAPDCLSISYLIGSAAIGISMITLNSCGTRLPAVTSLMLIVDSKGWRANCADAHTTTSRTALSLQGPRGHLEDCAITQRPRGHLEDCAITPKTAG